MTNRTRTGLGLLALTLGLAGCSCSRFSSTPSALSPVPKPTGLHVNGWVFDSAFRPLAAASVEVLDGPQAGTSATANAEGHLSLTGTFDDTTRFRATTEGHVAATQTWGRLSPSALPNLVFYRRIIG